MTADLHVMWTAGRARSLQLRADLTVVRSRFLRKGQHIETRHEMLNGRQVMFAAGGFLGAIVQFAERDTGYAELLGQIAAFWQGQSPVSLGLGVRISE